MLAVVVAGPLKTIETAVSANCWAIAAAVNDGADAVKPPADNPALAVNAATENPGEDVATPVAVNPLFDGTCCASAAVVKTG